MRRRMAIWTVLAVLGTTALVGCGDDGDGDGLPTTTVSTSAGPTTTGSGVSTTAPTSTSGPGPGTTAVTTTAPPGTSAATTTTAAGATSVRVYLVRGETIAAVRRSIAPTVAVGGAAMQQLIAGPTGTDTGYSSAVPSSTAVRSLAISDGTATVDLSAAFGSGGGSFSMRMRVAQVVWTLTQFPTVQRVRFLIDGVANPVLGGEGLMLDHAFTRAEYFDGDLVPRLLVESPLPGDRAVSPLRVTGLGSVFEATFNIQVVDSAGVTVYDRFAMTSEGQTMAPFDVTITFSPTRPGPVTLRVFDYSAKDGSVIDLVEVPLTAA
jgi:germination protein M